MHMIRFFQEQFAKLVIVHDQWMYRVREDLVVKEKPDIILNIVLETRVKNIIDFPFTLSVDQPLEQSINIQAANGKYCCAEPDCVVVANREKPSSWETFTFVRYYNNECAFLSFHNFFLSADLRDKGKVNMLAEIVIGEENLKKFFLSADLHDKGKVNASAEIANGWEKFKLIELEDGFVAFKADNGKYLGLDEKTQQLFAIADIIGENEKFKITVVK